MKHWDEYLNSDRVKWMVEQIHTSVKSDRTYRFMEFCGGHTHSLFRYGLTKLLPKQIQMIHGPGCPVCVLPSSRIHAAIELLENNPDFILHSYGDLMRVPTKKGDNLIKAKARGMDIRQIYDPLDIIKSSQKESDKTHIFFAIGFETTTPPTALLLLKLKQLEIKNVLVYCNHVLTPPAARTILRDKETPIQLDGLVGPGHVCTITGTRDFEDLSRKFELPVAISGFLPVDMLQSILSLVTMSNEARPDLFNQYARSVKTEGNTAALNAMDSVFEIRSEFEWRGLGNLSDSALKIAKEFSEYDAEKKLQFTKSIIKEHPHCLCPKILRGQATPTECKLFGKACTPETPLGSCMVSSEGSCSAYFSYQEGV